MLWSFLLSYDHYNNRSVFQMSGLDSQLVRGNMTIAKMLSEQYRILMEEKVKHYNVKTWGKNSKQCYLLCFNMPSKQDHLRECNIHVPGWSPGVRLESDVLPPPHRHHLPRLPDHRQVHWSSLHEEQRGLQSQVPHASLQSLPGPLQWLDLSWWVRFRFRFRLTINAFEIYICICIS